MNLFRRLVVLTYCLLALPALKAQARKLGAAEAKGHIGDRVTDCGKVASTHHAKSSNGEPTFLNLDEPYPKEVFTILFWGSDREKFGAPEDQDTDLLVRVTAKITSYRSR